ncbi:MAG TPA: pitrilysin family protein [Balneolaceae bacterium]
MKKLTFTCLLVFFAASFSQAQKRYDELTYPEINEFQKPQVETFTTDNGIKFFLVEDNELPLINVNVEIRTGGVMVPNEKTGLASITGMVIRSGGTEAHPADELNVLLENNAASIETWIGFSSGGGRLNVLKEDFENLLPVLVDVLANPVFPEDKIELAKTRTKSGISRRNDNPRQIGFREFDRLIYGKNTVYGRNTEYETINNITREDLVNFHDEYFVAENLMVGVVGDFEASEMKEKLQKAFADFPTGKEASLDFPQVNYEPQHSINFINKSNVNQSFVMMGHLGGLRSNPDYAKIQVMNQVLSGGFSGRLFQVVRTDMGLAYSVFGHYGMNSFYPGQFYTGVMTKSATTAEAIDAIIKEVERLQNEPITEEELQATKDQILNSAVFEYDSYEQVLYQQMSYAYRGLPANSFEQYIEGVKATTVEDVQRVAQKYMNPDQLQILVVGNKEQIGDQLQKYGEVNIIDITIPQPGDDKKQLAEGDVAKGSELLVSMAQAIIAADTQLNTLSVSGEVLAMNRTIPTTMTMDYPDTIEQTLETPRGTMVLSYKNGKAMMSMGAIKRPLPAASPMVSGLKASLNRSIIAIALKNGELEPVFTGTETIDGKTYNAISVKVGDTNLNLLLDQATHYPVIMKFQKFVPMQGKTVTVENHYADWKTVDGVAYPYSQITLVDGQKRAEMTVESHQPNK